MVQAIVFLPLLGAILAGLIALFGAHARNPRATRSSITAIMATATRMRRRPMTTMVTTITLTMTTTMARSSRRPRARGAPS